MLVLFLILQIQEFFKSDDPLSTPEFLLPDTSDSTAVKELKENIYKEISKCWSLNVEARPDPTVLLRALVNCAQCDG